VSCGSRWGDCPGSQQVNRSTTTRPGCHGVKGECGLGSQLVASSPLSGTRLEHAFPSGGSTADGGGGTERLASLQGRLKYLLGTWHRGLGGCPLPSADVWCVAGTTFHLGSSACLTGVRNSGLRGRVRTGWPSCNIHGARFELVMSSSGSSFWGGGGEPKVAALFPPSSSLVGTGQWDR
jgi:hypothetical protein